MRLFLRYSILVFGVLGIIVGIGAIGCLLAAVVGTLIVVARLLNGYPVDPAFCEALQKLGAGGIIGGLFIRCCVRVRHLLEGVEQRLFLPDGTARQSQNLWTDRQTPLFWDRVR